MPKSGSSPGPKAPAPSTACRKDQQAREESPDQTEAAAVVPDRDGRTGSASARPVILALDGVDTPLDGRFICLPLSQLDAVELERLAPDIITCALFWDKFDAIHVINRLNELSYSGQIVVIAEYLPNPGLVERELRAFGPGPRLHLLSQDRNLDDLPH